VPSCAPILTQVQGPVVLFCTLLPTMFTAFYGLLDRTDQ